MKSNASIWSDARQPRGDDALSNAVVDSAGDVSATEPCFVRSRFQQDYDRLLFSTPVRRLSDKTQVWPMDENDGVRTRLTHSHEVANLARSIGSRAYTEARAYFKGADGREVDLLAVVQPLLLSIGLSHDLGNPPFGHQGEAAISQWFVDRKHWIFTHTSEGGDLLERPVEADVRDEFSDFDGNPQGLRLLARLQTHIDGVGLDLTAATLAAGLKYPVSYKNRGESSISKKGGYFQSESSIVDWVRASTGLGEYQRHPLTWIMEACDDIAYSVLDVDDVLKKGMMSPDDVLVILKRKHSEIPAVQKISDKFIAIEGKEIGPEMQRDIKIQYLRAYLIENLIGHATCVFVENADEIFSFRHEISLMDSSDLCETLKGVAKLAAFNHPSVLRAEALGAVAIDGLMTALWDAISNRKSLDEFRSRRRTARAKYVFSLISPNYVEQACRESSGAAPELCQRYRELRLLTDMVSGMTDSFAIRLWKNLKSIPNVNRP
ncbi:dGTP triphosphohydrolase [Lelliottia jeotgali]